MKKVIVALAVFLCSFSYAQGSAKDMEPIPQALENFVGYKVASINSGKLSMTSVIDFQKALENRLKMDSNLSISFNDSKIGVINNNYYLVMKSKEGYVSKTRLKFSGNSLLTEGITCTTRECSSLPVCVPNDTGDACTYCYDCTKTVTGPVNPKPVDV